MFSVAYAWLFNYLYSNQELARLLADNVAVPTRELEDGSTVKRPAIYDTSTPTNIKMPYVVIRPEMAAGGSNGGLHFSMSSYTLNFDVYDDSTSSLTAARIVEIITSALEFVRTDTSENIYRFYTNQDLLNLPEDDREQITHLAFTATMRFVRQDYAEIFDQ